jgi:hypothetical protein
MKKHQPPTANRQRPTGVVVCVFWMLSVECSVLNGSALDQPVVLGGIS